MILLRFSVSLALLFPTILVCNGQSVIEAIGLQGEESPLVSNLNSEKVEKISKSKKIYLITNNNQSFQKGDFISLIFKGTMFARALVAKDINGLSGIKILRIYAPETASYIRPGHPIQVVRGDDSLFRYGGKKELVLKNEEDLFNQTVLGESKNDIELEEREQNLIKQDNIISIWYGQIEGANLQGGSTHYGQILASWSYQVGDNIWAEASYGQNVINDYPEIGFDTKLQNFTLKFKYTIATPAHSYVQPYIGYQLATPQSPGAGKQNPTAPVSPEQLELELQRLDLLKKNNPIFGLSMLKRLVPGWFIKFELGSDIMGLGLALEF